MIIPLHVRIVFFFFPRIIKIYIYCIFIIR